MFGVLTAVLHIAGRHRWTRRERELANELARTHAQLERANLFLASEPQIVVAWDSPNAKPRFEGDLALIGDSPAPERALAFSAWLEPSAAAKAEETVRRLLERGESFSLAAAGLRGRHFEIVGRAIAGDAVMRVRDVSGDRLQLLRLNEAHAAALASFQNLRKLLDQQPNPAWTRARDGALEWVNLAYVRAVEAADAFATVDQKLELFDSTARIEAKRARAQREIWRSRAPATVNGQRRMFDAYELTTEHGSVGLALDISEADALRLEAERSVEAYRRIFDKLSTAVAIFDRSRRLTFYNAAYCQIWGLDPVYLDQHPADGEILDKLRAKRHLPEQADFRSWKSQVLASYQAMEPIETVWHLPDGRALRVSVSQNPQGGVTYLYDDATQSFALASQVNAMTRVQGETLDALKEGVAVFGADGRLKFSNPSFLGMWRLDPERASARPHIDELGKQMLPIISEPETWEHLRGAVVGLAEARNIIEQRLHRTDGQVLDCAALPLPDGATLLTFFDTTANANVERALTERNEALIGAEKLRNDFVNHVSYELRTPLTNIIGFTQLLADGGAGPLNPKQIEYAGYIRSSSSALLAIINDILDLASIDAGALELRLEKVEVEEMMRTAAEGVQDRLRENNIDLRIVATGDVGAFEADGRRLRQVLFNLLSNAISFSEAGQTVTLAAMRRGPEVVFKVSDRGRGIPPEALDKVFERFESLPNGARHRGPGLGLSIVRALVELHGGRVTIESVVGEGTLVTCFFPVKPAQAIAKTTQPAA